MARRLGLGCPTVRLAMVFAIAGAVCAAAAPAKPGTAGVSGRIQLQPCPTERSAPAGAVNGALCGTLKVPEDRSRRDGRLLPLKVMVLPRTGTEDRGPIYVLPGGPGVVTTRMVPAYANLPFRRRHDIVFMDLRGAGEGHWLGCRVGGTDDDLQGYLKTLFSQGRAYEQCRRELEKTADLNQFTMPNAMRDLEALRQALGHGKIWLDAGSYGTRAALVYSRMFEDHVRGAVLTAAAPFENRTPLHHAKAAQASLRELTRQCHQSRACRTAFPDIEGDATAVLERLARQPQRVEVMDRARNQPVTLTLDRDGFAEGLRVLLYYDDTLAKVPGLLRKARNGDVTAFAQTSLDANRKLYGQLALGMTLSYTCSEDVARIDPSEIPAATSGSFVGDTRVRGQLAACAVWARHPTSELYVRPFVSKVPLVIVSGRLDPVTPLTDGETVRKSFPNSVHLVFPGGHGTGGECFDAVSTSFYDGTSIANLDTSCVARTPGPDFMSGA